MKRTVITVGGVTYAMKLRKLLTKEKVGARLIKLDNTNEGNGCTHGVEIDESDLYSAVVVLKKHNFDYKIHDMEK